MSNAVCDHDLTLKPSGKKSGGRGGDGESQPITDRRESETVTLPVIYHCPSHCNFWTLHSRALASLFIRSEDGVWRRQALRCPVTFKLPR